MGEAVSTVLTSQVAFNLVYPAIALMVTGVAGYLQQLPWMYILVGALAAAAFVNQLLKGLADRRRDHSAEHKLVFAGIEPHPIIENGKIVGLQPLILLRNIAYFPVQYYIDTDYMSVAGNVGQEYARDTTKPVLFPGATGTRPFGVYPLDPPVEPRGRREVEARCHLKYSYGHPGKLKFQYELFFKVRFVLILDGNGAYQWFTDLVYSEPFSHR